MLVSTPARENHEELYPFYEVLKTELILPPIDALRESDHHREPANSCFAAVGKRRHSSERGENSRSLLRFARGAQAGVLDI